MLFYTHTPRLYLTKTTSSRIICLECATGPYSKRPMSRFRVWETESKCGSPFLFCFSKMSAVQFTCWYSLHLCLQEEDVYVMKEKARSTNYLHFLFSQHYVMSGTAHNLAPNTKCIYMHGNWTNVHNIKNCLFNFFKKHFDSTLSRMH